MKPRRARRLWPPPVKKGPNQTAGNDELYIFDRQKRRDQDQKFIGSPVFADPAQKLDSSDEARIAALAKQWFVDMQQGKVDRSQYAPAYAAQINDGAVQAMSGNLNRYGAPPLQAEIAKIRKIGGQVFYVVEFLFPHGEATALTFGFDASGKINGVAAASMAGD